MNTFSRIYYQTTSVPSYDTIATKLPNYTVSLLIKATLYTPNSNPPPNHIRQYLRKNTPPNSRSVLL